MKSIGSAIWSAGGVIGIGLMTYRCFTNQLDLFDRCLIGTILVTVGASLAMRGVDK